MPRAGSGYAAERRAWWWYRLRGWRILGENVWAGGNELDLIVREFIKDTEAWRGLTWYPYFDAARDASRWLVMRTAEHRYALFFPRADATPAP